MATGVLPLLIGKGTLCSKYLINHDKIYQAKIQLGQKTDTADAEGEIIEEKIVPNEIFKNGEAEKDTCNFCWETRTSATYVFCYKSNGKKLYEYARKGQTVEIQPRQIEIYDIQLMELDNENKQLQFQVSCSKVHILGACVKT